MKFSKRMILIVSAFFACMFFAACSSLAVQPPAAEVNNAPGFWLGLWHGFIILFSFIASFFGDYRVYAFPNAGHWYDFGFLFGASMFLSGSNKARHFKNKKEKVIEKKIGKAIEKAIDEKFKKTAKKKKKK